jgi:hypothetical protein
VVPTKDVNIELEIITFHILDEAKSTSEAGILDVVVFKFMFCRPSFSSPAACGTIFSLGDRGPSKDPGDGRNKREIDPKHPFQINKE